MAQARGDPRERDPRYIPHSAGDFPVGLKALPENARMVRVFDVDYVHMKTEHGDLYLSRWGWPWRNQLQPENWYADGRYHKGGERLGGTGTSYHVQTNEVDGKSADIVVKWNRVGSDIPGDPMDPALSIEHPELASKMRRLNSYSARFNSPFEEFGFLMELRAGEHGNPSVKILTQRPLAIFSPRGEVEPLRMGRRKYVFESHQKTMREDQAGKAESESVGIDLQRQYAVLYGWVKGEDAAEMMAAGVFTKEDVVSLMHTVIDDMERKGYTVADTKPHHFILRRRSKDGSILRDREGKPVYALVDFELLERTREHEVYHQHQRRAEYFRHLINRFTPPPQTRYPQNLRPHNVLGVDYVWGPTESTGGELFVVGRDPDLFDYFRPERWYWASKTKLSPTHEIYHTKTRDDVHLVWQMSRVGLDPAAEYGESAGEAAGHGFNSPFEEARIAEELRKRGIRTTYPRAIYMCGNEMLPSQPSDQSRFMAPDAILNPSGHPVLRPDRAYITIWGYWGGLDPLEGYRQEGHWVYIDLVHALEKDVVTPEGYKEILSTSKQQLAEVGLDSEDEPHKLLMTFTEEGRLNLNEDGTPKVTLGVDSYRARVLGSLREEDYFDLQARESRRLREAGYENLNPSGHHILLTYDLGEGFRKNAEGGLEATHSVLDLFRQRRESPG